MEVGSENYRTRVGSMKFKSKYYRIRFGNMEVGIGHLAPHQSWHMTPRIRIIGRHRTYPYLLSIGGPRCTCKARPMFAPVLCPNTQWGRQCRQQVLFESGLNLYWIWIRVHASGHPKNDKKSSACICISQGQIFHQFPTSQAVISSPRNGYAKIIGHQCTQTQTCKYQKSSI